MSMSTDSSYAPNSDHKSCPDYYTECEYGLLLHIRSLNSVLPRSVLISIKDHQGSTALVQGCFGAGGASVDCWDSRAAPNLARPSVE